MPDVQFEQEQIGYTDRFRKVVQQPRMVKMLMGMGIAENEGQANVILICTAILIFLISLFIIYRTFAQDVSVNNSRSTPTVNMPLGPR